MCESLKEAEEKLFNYWRKRRGDRFVSDGVVCEEIYLNSDPKIVFILKETNDYADDLRGFLRNNAEGRGYTWNNVARWTYCVQALWKGKQPCWKDVEKAVETNRGRFLQSICVINLKKTPGKGSTTVSLLKKCAEEDRDLICKQYSIYDPDLTICGGVGNLFKYLIGYGSVKWYYGRGKRCRWFERDKGKFIIDFYHPQARIKKQQMFVELMEAIENVLQEGRRHPVCSMERC